MIMAIGSTTPRDQLDRIFAFVRRALRYWWLVGVITVVGGGLATLLALKTQPKYMSEARLLYNEKINSSLLQGRNVMAQTRNLGNRYREMLMARRQLSKVITELDLHKDVVKAEGVDAAVEEIKKYITFRVRGSGMFHIQYISADPDQSQAVTEMLTNLLIDEDRRIRRENALATKKFLQEQKTEAILARNKRTKALAAFLAEHPEFVSTAGQQATGAAALAASQDKGESPIPNADTMDPRLLALERQRRRIKTRLAAPDKPVKRVDTPEIREAKQVVRQAKRDLEAAERRLADLEQQLQAAHPDVRKAKSRVEEAKKRLKRAQDAVPPAPPTAGPIDRAALKSELEKVERQISSTKSRIRKEKSDKDEPEVEKPDEDPEENYVVALESQYDVLKREFDEANRRVNKLDASLSNAEITADQQMAEEGAVLTIIDPANLPSRPQGKGKLILVVAGVFVFAILGSVLALALALVDDRIYTAGDLEGLGIAPVMVVIPKPRKKRRFRRG